MPVVDEDERDLTKPSEIPRAVVGAVGDRESRRKFREHERLDVGAGSGAGVAVFAGFAHEVGTVSVDDVDRWLVHDYQPFPGIAGPVSAFEVGVLPRAYTHMEISGCRLDTAAPDNRSAVPG